MSESTGIEIENIEFDDVMKFDTAIHTFVIMLKHNNEMKRYDVDVLKNIVSEKKSVTTMPSIKDFNFSKLGNSMTICKTYFAFVAIYGENLHVMHLYKNDSTPTYVDTIKHITLVQLHHNNTILALLDTDNTIHMYTYIDNDWKEDTDATINQLQQTKRY